MLLNGVAINSVSAFDRGLQYGDGLFETIAVKDKQPCLWQQHMQRLQSGCQRLGISSPDPALLLEEAELLIGSQQTGVLKILVTRGESCRGYAAPPDIQSNRILYLSDWPSELVARADAGIRLRLCTSRLSLNPALAGMKHLNRLEQVLARREWQDEAVLEGVMQDIQGRVVEGTMSNLFVEKNGQLRTAELNQCGVAGVMRQLVLDVAAGISRPVCETQLQLDDMHQSDACYITNSLLGVRQVMQFEQTSFKRIGQPHPVMQLAAERAFRF